MNTILNLFMFSSFYTLYWVVSFTKNVVNLNASYSKILKSIHLTFRAITNTCDSLGINVDTKTLERPLEHVLATDYNRTLKTF